MESTSSPKRSRNQTSVFYYPTSRSQRSKEIMSGCLDNIRCDCDCELAEKAKEWCNLGGRNMIASIVAGTFFSLGWWLVIDAVIDYAEPLYAAYFVCGIFSTIALFMINAISNARVMGDDYNDGIVGRRGARVWIFFGFLFAFAGIVGALWIFVQQFIVPIFTIEAPTANPSLFNVTEGHNSTVSPMPAIRAPLDNMFQGFAFLLQNIFIFISTMVFKFGRKEQLDDSW